jgi:hypothetical protein
MMSRIDSQHWKISTGRHFQNGHHNTAKIQHCPISSKFDIWVDNDVPNWFPTLKNFYRSPFSKWLPHYRNNSTLSDIIKSKNNKSPNKSPKRCLGDLNIWTNTWLLCFFDIVHTIKCANLFILIFSLFENAAKNKKLFHLQNQGAYLQNG